MNITKKERDELEATNQHGELALRLAQSFGTLAEVERIKTINAEHMQKGFITAKDQKERDAISTKYYQRCPAFGTPLLLAPEWRKGDHVLIHGNLSAVVEERDPDTGDYVCIDCNGDEHDVHPDNLD